jgi:uncharacterized protein
LRVKIELGIVLALSLGASAAYSILSFLAKITSPGGLHGQTATINRQLAEREWLDFSYQTLGIVLGLAPVALALFLLWEKGKSPFFDLGLNFKHPYRDLTRGFWLAAAVGIPGLALYFGSRALGISAEVVVTSVASYWWTIPILLLGAVKAALLEEIVVVGYLFKRLGDLGYSWTSRIWFSALLRASYHLYQGIGGFIGNLLMGLVFGWVYKRFGRVMPLVVAHFLLDAFAFVGYFLLGDFLQSSQR